MRKTLLSTLIVGLLLGATAQAKAQEEAAAKPLVVVSIAGVDELMKDVDYVAQLAGQPAMAGMVKGPAEQFLAGVDKTKPWGVTVKLGPLGTPSVLGFVPVSDMDKLKATIGGVLGEPEDAGNGIIKITVPAGAFPVDVMIKEANGWAFFAQTAEELGDLPADPTTWLEGMNETYDIAVRGNMQSLPPGLRQQAIDALQQGFEAGERPAGEGDAQYKLRKQLQERQLQNLKDLLNDLDQVTIGWTIDQTAQKTFFEFAMTALEDTRTAKRMNQLQEATTNLAGFNMSDSVFRMVMASKLHEEDIAQGTAMLEQFRRHLAKEIDESEDFKDDQTRRFVKGLMDELFDVGVATLEKGKLDAGAVMVGSGPFTLAGGMEVAQGKALEESLEKLARVVAAEEGVEVEMNAGEHEGVKFHQITMPIADPDAKKFFGEGAKLTLGTSESKFYAAFGQTGIETLTKVIDASATAGETSVQPLEASIALKPLISFFAAQEEGEDAQEAQMMAQLLEAGKDHINIFASGIPNGAKYRYEIEEGVIKMAVQASMMAGAGAAGGPPAEGGNDF